MGERSYAEDSAGSIDALRMCVGEYVPGRAGLRSDMQRAIDGLEQAQVDADDEIAALRRRVAELEAGLRKAADDMEDWAAYAAPEYRQMHDLNGDLRKARALLGEGGGS